MFKVYSIYGKDRFLTESFFIKINKKISWLSFDIKMNDKPYFSNELINEILSKSSFKTDLIKMKDGDFLDIQYGSCSNHYHLIKMKKNEVEDLEEIQLKKLELKKIQHQIKKTIPNELINKEKMLQKELKKLNIKTM